MTVASVTCSPAATSLASLAAPSASTATRSSSDTGAERWEMPTTRTLIGQRSRHVRLPLLVVGQDLQLDRQVDLAHVHALRDVQHHRSEVEDAADTGGHHP